MPYTSIPVPADQVEDVLRFIEQALARARQSDWDRETVEELYADLDELERATLDHVSRAHEAGGIEEGRLTAAVQISPREVASIVRDLRDRSAELQRPPLLVRRTEIEGAADGRSTEVGIIAMEPTAVDLVIAVGRDDLLGSTPTPTE